ncbi:ArsR/SmtB family transcription factor [Haloferax sp. S1W]|uniref:ArsR/SmtB family transcription factor n=1 Tax=Haloferax sp. S1W TaxID=3377110 RepID=UPI0037C92471
MQTGLTRIQSDTSPPEAWASLVLDALADQTCRRMLTTLRESRDPMTAQELSAVCDVPLSTTYRKLERLTDARLVDETLQLRASGTHTHQYRPRVDSVTLKLNGDEEVEINAFGED